MDDLNPTSTSPGGHVQTDRTPVLWPRTAGEHLAEHDAEIARLNERLADLNTVVTQLQEIVLGQPPFLQPTGNYHLNE